MCDATTIAAASFVTGAGSSILGYKAQADEAAANAKNVEAGLVATYKDLGTRQLEETQSATQQKQVIARQAAVAKGQASAGAAAGGVSGVSVDLLLSDISKEAGNASDTVSQNLSATDAQLQREKDAARVQAQSQINQMPYPGLPSLLLNVAAKGLSTYRDIRAIKDPTFRTGS